MWQLFLELLPEIPYLSAMWILVILTLAIHVTFALPWLFDIQFLFIRDKSLLLCNCISLEWLHCDDWNTCPDCKYETLIVLQIKITISISDCTEIHRHCRHRSLPAPSRQTNPTNWLREGFPSKHLSDKGWGSSLWLQILLHLYWL